MPDAEEPSTRGNGPTARQWWRAFFRRYGAALLLLSFAVGMALTAWGYYWGAAWPSGSPTTASPAAFPQGMRVTESAYKGLLAFWFNASDAFVADWTFQLGRLIALAVAAVVGFKAVGALLGDSLARQRARWLRGHCIVCGYGELGRTVVRSLLQDKKRVVLIEQDPGVAAEVVARDGLIVIRGDATDSAVLNDAGVLGAERAFIGCGDDNRNAGVASAFLGARTAVDSKPPLSVSVHIDDPMLLSQIAPRALSTSTRRTHLTFCNVGLMMAKRVLEERGVICDADARPGVPEPVAIFGWAPMTEAIVLTLARDSATCAKPAYHVAIVDPLATAVVERLTRRYDDLCSYVRITAIDDDPATLEEKNRQTLFQGPNPFVVGFACMDDDSATVAVALKNAGDIRRNSGRATVTACVYGRSGLADLLQSGAHDRVEMLDVTTALEPADELHDVVERLGIEFHETYLAGNPAKDRPAAVPWERLPLRYRLKNYDLALSIPEKLKAIDCGFAAASQLKPISVQPSDADIDVIARLEHERWQADLFHKDGWTQGRRNEREHSHPDLVDWDTLDEDAKDKDRAIARTMNASALRVLGVDQLHVVRLKAH